jgi:hypothetical protein
MAELDVLADTDFGDRAVAEADAFVKAYRHPVARTQIAGLWQIIANEPAQLVDFANHQRQRAEARDKPDEVAFWDLIKNLCAGTKPKHTWSLLQARNDALALRADLAVPRQVPGARLGPEEREDLEKRKKAQKEWLAQWDKDHYPVFFRRFCAHYLHDMPPEK